MAGFLRLQKGYVYMTGNDQEWIYGNTWEDFDVAVRHACGTSEESQICSAIFAYFNMHPEKFFEHPRMIELGYTIKDIRGMLDIGLSGCITEFD